MQSPGYSETSEPPALEQLDESFGQPAVDVALLAAVETIHNTSAPEGVDPAVWQALTDELERVLLETGADKLVSTPPRGLNNSIVDLHRAAVAGGGTALGWTHHCTGDYDQNGEVNISDLTPVGVHFGATPTSPAWGAAQLADGDGNGEVNISDITPIGQNFAVSTAVFHLYSSADPTDYPGNPDAPNGPGTNPLGAAEFSSGTPGILGRMHFEFEIPAPVADDVYWLRSSDGPADGVASNLVGGGTRSDWWAYGRNERHAGLSPFVGSSSSNILWTYDAGAEIESSPVIGGNGVIYIGCDDNNLHAVLPDGTQDWTFPTGDRIVATPAVSPDGTIYVGSHDTNLYALNPDGTLAGTYTAATDDGYSPVIAPDGTVYFPSVDNSLHAVTGALAPLWTFAAGDAIQACPAVADDGTIYFGCYDNTLYAVMPDGSERWTFPVDGQIRNAVSIGADGVIYAASSDHHLYAVNPDGSERWRYDVNAPISSSPSIGADGAIYIATFRYLYAVNPDGTLRWRFNSGFTSIHSKPAIGTDGTIYFGTTSGRMYAVNNDGSMHWSYNTEAEIYSSPAIGPDGTIYVGCADGTLFAFNDQGAGTPAAVEEVQPLSGLSGNQLEFSALHSGTLPITYTWDFGSAASPSISTLTRPVVTLGAPGVYPCSVSVQNAHGPTSSVDFELTIHEQSGTGTGWTHSWGGLSNDVIWDIAMDAAGNVYAVGHTDSFGQGRSDVLLLKYSPAGELLQALTWGSNFSDQAAGVALDTSGNIYVTGRTFQVSLGDADMFALKFSPTFELLWQKYWDTGISDYGKAVTIDAAGNVLLAGYSWDYDTDVGSALAVWLDPAGNNLGGVSWDGIDEDRFICIAVDGPDIYLAGYTASFGEGGNDLLLVKANSTAGVIWDRTFGASDNEDVRSMALDAAGNVYIGASVDAIVSFDSDGNLRWANSWEGDRDFVIRGLVADDPLIYLAGTDYTTDLNDDVILVQGTTDGAVNWGRMWVAPYIWDAGFSMDLAPGGSICIGGISGSNLGGWSEVELASIGAPGVVGIPGVAFVDAVGTGGDLAGVVQSATGTQDTWGGEEDALVLVWDFED